MKKTPIISIFVLIFFVFSCKPSKNERVKAALSEKTAVLDSLFKKIDCKMGDKTFIRVFKQEKELEIWIENANTKQFTLLKTYPICAASGNLGRKYKEGDKQVPEGCYTIAQYNSQSSYWLSLGLNYPNDADKIVADKDAPGSDIFIHGKCASIGCMAMTDDCIKEIYLIAERAKAAETVNVHIFPFRMNDENLRKHTANSPENTVFWANLQTIFNYFEEKHQIPTTKIDEKGNYLLAMIE